MNKKVNKAVVGLMVVSTALVGQDAYTSSSYKKANEVQSKQVEPFYLDLNDKIPCEIKENKTYVVSYLVSFINECVPYVRINTSKVSKPEPMIKITRRDEFTWGYFFEQIQEAGISIYQDKENELVFSSGSSLFKRQVSLNKIKKIETFMQRGVIEPIKKFKLAQDRNPNPVPTFKAKNTIVQNESGENQVVLSVDLEKKNKKNVVQRELDKGKSIDEAMKAVYQIGEQESTPKRRTKKKETEGAVFAVSNEESYKKQVTDRSEKLRNEKASTNPESNDEGKTISEVKQDTESMTNALNDALTIIDAKQKKKDELVALKQMNNEVSSEVEKFKDSKKRSIGNPVAWFKGLNTVDIDLGNLDPDTKKFIHDLMNKNNKLKNQLKEQDADLKALPHTERALSDANFTRYQIRKEKLQRVTENRIADKLTEIDTEIEEGFELKEKRMLQLARKQAENEAKLNKLMEKPKNFNIDLSLLEPRMVGSYHKSEIFSYSLSIDLQGKHFNQVTFKNIYIMPRDNEQKNLRTEAFNVPIKPFMVEGVNTVHKLRELFFYTYAVSDFKVALIGFDVDGTKITIDGILDTIFDESLNYQRFAAIGKYLLEHKEDARGAQLAYTQAARLNPNSSDIRYNLGVCYLKRNKYLHAISHLQAALKGNPRDSEIMKMLGDAMIKRGLIYVQMSGYMPDPGYENENFYRSVMNQIPNVKTEIVKKTPSVKYKQNKL